MNQRTIAMAERAIVDFIKRNRQEHDYFRGRLIKAEDLPAPKQHMVSAAMRKLDWYKVELMELEGELDMLREELGLEQDTIVIFASDHGAGLLVAGPCHTNYLPEGAARGWGRPASVRGARTCWATSRTTRVASRSGSSSSSTATTPSSAASSVVPR